MQGGTHANTHTRRIVAVVIVNVAHVFRLAHWNGDSIHKQIKLNRKSLLCVRPPHTHSFKKVPSSDDDISR